MDLTRTHFIRLCAGGLAAAVLPACGGNNSKPDANPGPGIDAPKPVDGAIDAPVDAPIDAAVDAPIDAAVDAPIDPPVDAAIDAAPVDAPPIDAPPSDAPIDAPPVDAPPVDAPIDAPPIDAPPIDAPIDAPPIDAPPMSGCTQNGTTVTIIANHGHIMMVSKADVIAGVTKTYNITGMGGHFHSVTVTATMFVSLQNGMPASTNSSSNGHIHGISIVCV